MKATPTSLASSVVATILALSHLGCSMTVANTENAAPGARPAAAHAYARREDPAFNEVAGADAPDAPEEATDAQAWQAVATALGRPGELKDGVLTVTVPRDDLEVTVEDNVVPVAAGLASEFRFYRCPCGRINVVGQFVVADYEANDVIDALRQVPDARLEVASVGPLLLHERPRLTLIRVFGENKRGGTLARTLRTALSWTGKERMAPQAKP
jgi:hypothetical protein